MVDLDHTIDVLAKWAAKQPDPIKAGTAVVQFLSQVAQVRTEGTAAQKADISIRVQALVFEREDFLSDLERFNHQTGELMGWW